LRLIHGERGLDVPDHEPDLGAVKKSDWLVEFAVMV